MNYVATDCSTFPSPRQQSERARPGDRLSQLLVGDLNELPGPIIDDSLNITVPGRPAEIDDGELLGLDRYPLAIFFPADGDSRRVTRLKMM